MKTAFTFGCRPEIKVDHTKTQRKQASFNIQLAIHFLTLSLCQLICLQFKMCYKVKLRRKILSLPDTRVSAVHLSVLDHFKAFLKG